MLCQIKPSTTAPPSYFTSMLSQEGLKKIKGILDHILGKYKYVFMIIGGIGVGIGIILYFVYNQQEASIELLKIAKQTLEACKVV